LNVFDLFNNFMVYFGSPIIASVFILAIGIYLFRKEGVSVEAFIIPLPLVFVILADKGFIPEQIKYIVIIGLATLFGLAMIKLFKV